ARLGMIPEQNSQGGKYPLIRLVLPNSIAAKQGFQANDEIVAINGMKFDSLFDAFIIFDKVRLDRDVGITVLRKETSLDSKIPAEALKDFAGPEVKDLGKNQYDVLFRFKPNKKVESVAVA